MRCVESVLLVLEAHPLFTKERVFFSLNEHPHGKKVTIYLSENTYVILQLYPCVFSYPEEVESRVCVAGKDVYGLSAEIPSLYSTKGKGTGFFLLHLAMTLAVVAGAMEIRIENMTDDPERAAKGIYSLFLPDLRLESSDTIQSITLSQWNRWVERVYVVGPDSLSRLQKCMNTRVVQEIEKEAGEGGAGEGGAGEGGTGGARHWRLDAPDGIERLYDAIRVSE